MLAAGNSRRFGGEKLLARLGRVPVLQQAIDAACGSAVLSCTLVLGDGAPRALAAVDTRRCAVVVNRDWQSGLASSIRCGLRRHRGDDACIIALGDQPLVGSDDLNRLIEAWSSAHRAPVVALRSGDVWGAPALFPRRDFAALGRLRGDAGAKRYAAQREERLLFVDAADVHVFEDIDTRADLIRLNERGTRRTLR